MSRLGGARSGSMVVYKLVLGVRYGWSSIFVLWWGGAGERIHLFGLGVVLSQDSSSLLRGEFATSVSSSSLSLGGIAGSAQRSSLLLAQPLGIRAEGRSCPKVFATSFGLCFDYVLDYFLGGRELFGDLGGLIQWSLSCFWCGLCFWWFGVCFGVGERFGDGFWMIEKEVL